MQLALRDGFRIPFVRPIPPIEARNDPSSSLARLSYDLHDAAASDRSQDHHLHILKPRKL